MSDLIATNQIDDVFHIILNRPDKRNAVNMEMFHALDDAVKTASQSDARAVIFRGEGGAFSAGIDLSFHLVEKLHGEAIARSTATYMEYRRESA